MEQREALPESEQESNENDIVIWEDNKQQELEPLNAVPLMAAQKSVDEHELERFNEIRACFFRQFFKAKTEEQQMVRKKKFLEALVRLVFTRLNYKVKTDPTGRKELDLLAFSKKQNRVFCIEVTNWAEGFYPNVEYKIKDTKRAFKELSKHVTRLWIVSYKVSLSLLPDEEKQLAKSPYWIHFLELGRDYNYQDTGFDDYLKIKEKIRGFLESLP